MPELGQIRVQNQPGTSCSRMQGSAQETARSH